MANNCNEASKDNKYAPVVAFAYNRADKIIRCLESLEKNSECSETHLIIYCDGARNEKGWEKVNATRAALCDYRERAGFASVTIHEAESNKGLARSIIEGVTKTLDDYGRAIIVEDDLIVSENFLSYMNGALDFYKDNPRIGAVSGYTYPMKALDDYEKDIYIMHKGDCWGWATWKDKWNSAAWADVDFEAYFADKKLRKRFENTENGWDLLMLLQSRGKISSWAVRWVLNLLKENLWTVYPRYSYVTNAGFDGSGTHSNKSEENHFFTTLKEQQSCRFEELLPDKRLEHDAARFPRKGFKQGSKYYLKRCYVKIFDLIRLFK